MKLDQIKQKVINGEYVYTYHAEIERRADDLAFYQIESSILNGKILEEYQDIGLGESCLMVGFSENIPIHTVLGWRGEKVAVVTVYVPRPPKFIDPWTRRKKDDQKM